MLTNLIALMLAAILVMSIVTAVTTAVVEGGQQQQSDANNSVPILSSSVIRTQFGSTYIVGEVRNDFPNVVESVQVVGRFYDSSGRLIDTGSTYTELDQLRPEEKSPFWLSITNASVAQRIANYNLTVSWDQLGSSAKPAALSIVEGEQRRSGNENYEIVGEVINNGSQDTESVSVIATIYDQNGTVIGASSTFTNPSDVPAGQSAIFKISVITGNRSDDIQLVKLTTESSDYLMIDPELEQGMMQQIQQQQQQENNQTTFQSIEDGFRIQVPNRWVVGDTNNTDIGLRAEEEIGMGLLATVCPQVRALPAIGGNGTYECGTSFALGTVYIMRFKDLDDRPEFASIGNQSIPISDFLEFYHGFLRDEEPFSVRDIRIVNNTDTTVNVTSAQTNQTLTTVPAKLMEHTFTIEGGSELNEFSMLVLNGTTGYSIANFNLPSLRESLQTPRPVKQIFDSFELLLPSSGGNTSSLPSMMASSPSLQEQQQ
jgi:hypothetical protein